MSVEKQEPPTMTSIEAFLTICLFCMIIATGIASINFFTAYKSSQILEKDYLLRSSSPAERSAKTINKMSKPVFTDIFGIDNVDSNCSGIIQDPENATFYRKIHVDPILENFSRLEEYVFGDISRIYKQFHTVIFDCPPASTGNYSTEAFVTALGKFNSVKNPPMNVWLRLNQRADAKVNISYCTDFAILANNLFPGTITGILENSEILFAYTSEAANNLSLDLDNDQIWVSYAELMFARFSNLGLKFGLMISSADCNYFGELVPLIHKFDDLFYLDRESIGRGFNKLNPTLVVTHKFNECKQLIDDIVPGVQTVRYIITERDQENLPWNDSPASPYCLQFK